MSKQYKLCINKWKIKKWNIWDEAKNGSVECATRSYINCTRFYTKNQSHAFYSKYVQINIASNIYDAIFISKKDSGCTNWY